MRRLLITLIVFLSAQVAAQKSEFKYDPNSPEAIAAKEKYQSMEREAQALPTPDLYNELVRLAEAKRMRIALKSKPEDIFAEVMAVSDDDMKSATYASVLKKRSDSGEPVASFLYAVKEWEFCFKMQQQKGETWAKQAKDCWQNLMPPLKRASDAQIAAAAVNIAKLYEHGFGVPPSKLVAAEWYVKSADQYIKDRSRDDALTSIESALNLVPDHPAALRLRKAMLK